MRYDYPGNVRELGNILQYAVLMCEGDTISIGDLPSQLQRRSALSRRNRGFHRGPGGAPLREVEKRVIGLPLRGRTGTGSAPRRSWESARKDSATR